MLSAVRASRATVIVTLGALLWPLLDPLALAGQATPPKPATAKPPAPQPAPASAPSTPAASPAKALAWPRDYATASGGALRIFQPQVASWDNQQRITMYA